MTEEEKKTEMNENTDLEKPIILKQKFLNDEISSEEYKIEKEKLESKAIEETKIETEKEISKEAENPETKSKTRKKAKNGKNAKYQCEVCYKIYSTFNEAEKCEKSHNYKEGCDKAVLVVMGMHCESCAIMLDKELKKIYGVKKVSVSYAKAKAEIEYDPKKTDAEAFKKLIKSKGYDCDDFSRHKKETNKSGSYIQILILAGILGVLYLISKYIPFTIPQNIGLLAAFGIGLLVSMHCVGMCSSFVTSYSLKAKEDGLGGHKIHLIYNFGRVLSYTLIGGVLGLIGSAFIINQTFRGIIAIFAGVFMILFALNLMGLFKINLTPTFIYRIIGSIIHGNYKKEDAEKSSKGKAPFIVGLMNGLMPCGPLIAMELYALGTGNFFEGAGVMMFFGLGTVPAMFGLGTIIEKLSKEWTGKMLKISGIVILVLGLLTISRGLAFSGTDIGGISSSIIPSENMGDSNQNFSPEIVDGKQIIKMDVTASGYSPNKLLFKPGIPIKWIINAKTLTGCNREIIVRDYNLDIKLKQGENIVEFTPKEGDDKISFSCWMGMIQGAFVSAESSQASVPVPKGGGCGCGG